MKIDIKVLLFLETLRLFTSKDYHIVFSKLQIDCRIYIYIICKVFII